MNSVDLTNLRTMTDGDREIELMLFDEFYASCEQAINTLSAHCVEGMSEAWRATGHALKGSAYNMGAAKLGDLGKKVQDYPGNSQIEKMALLEQIKSEYAAVKAYLQQVHAA